MNIQTIYTKNLRWIDIVNPGPEEVRWLRDNFKFSDLHFAALAERQQRTRLDEQRGYDFIVLLFPVYDRKTQEIVPGEVDFFVGENFLVTAHYGNIYRLQKHFAQIRTDASSRAEHMQKGGGFLLYKILEALLRRSYPILDHMNEDISFIEGKIFHEEGKDMLSRIALMKKNIIEFRKMMKTHRSIHEKLLRRRGDHLAFPQSKIYYKELLEYSEDIWDILEALKETADTIADTSQSLATHRLNKITKVISLFSAVALPATLIAFLFGIGVEGIPFRHHPYGFWIVLTLMVLSSLLLVAIFKHKKWF